MRELIKKEKYKIGRIGEIESLIKGGWKGIGGMIERIKEVGKRRKRIGKGWRRRKWEKIMIEKDSEDRIKGKGGRIVIKLGKDKIWKFIEEERRERKNGNVEKRNRIGKLGRRKGEKKRKRKIGKKKLKIMKKEEKLEIKMSGK